MRIRDEGRSNAAHWYERAQAAEAEVERLRAELAARDAECARLREVLEAFEEGQVPSDYALEMRAQALATSKPKEPKP